MRFIPAAEINGRAFAEHEMMFLDCWYGLTHNHSLDSHRVKCMNARTVIHELCDELRIGRLDDLEFQGICQEASDLLKTDPVVSSVFCNGFRAVETLLETPTVLPGSSQKKNKESVENETQRRDLAFAITDLSASLESRYFPTLCNRLSAVIQQKGSNDEIERLTKSILSDLVSRGWTMEALFSWHQHFIKQSDRSFQNNLEFMIRQLKRPIEEFEVTLRINGGTRLNSISRFGPFNISSQSGTTPQSDAERRFAAPDAQSAFAKGVFRAVEFASAAIVARDEFEPFMDVLRFEYEHRLLQVDDRTYIKRIGDGKTTLTFVTNPVPNPVESLTEQDFTAFSQKLAAALAPSTLEPESRNRIETAFRRYRFGRDSHAYTDKFLNWWMGLEALCNVGGDKIGRSVSRNVSHSMLIGYMFRLLRDFLITLKYLRIEWSQELSVITGCTSLAELSVPGIVKLLRDEKQASVLWAQLSLRPLVRSRGQDISIWLTDPKKAASLLESHRKRLHWHLDRLYRIRCCIVHGSPVRFRLALFSANLEYYLKQTLILALDELHGHPHVTDLASLFQRSVLSWTRRLDALNATGATQGAIDDAIFATIVTHD